MIDLQDHHIQIVKDILSLYAKNHAVWAFGSRVVGRAKPHSDLDIVVITSQPLPFQKLEQLREAFAISNLPMRVDVLDWSRLDSSFRSQIESSHEVLQETHSQ